MDAINHIMDSCERHKKEIWACLSYNYTYRGSYVTAPRLQGPLRPKDFMETNKSRGFFTASFTAKRGGRVSSMMRKFCGSFWC